MLLSVLLLFASMQSSFAAEPAPAFLGDWDLGPGSSALRISPKDDSSVFVQFCKRSLLLSERVCQADLILYFWFDQTSEDYIHDDDSAQHLNATLQLDPLDSTIIHYIFKSDVGAGSLNGRRISAMHRGS